MSKPNILFVSTDQQRADHLGIAGLKGIATPSLDRLGRDGVHFRRAYCPSPICTPSRVSLLTGTYPSRHGAWTIGATADPFPAPTVADLLQDFGYRTALFGKSHFVSRLDEARHMTGLENPPSDFFRSWKGPYVGFQEFQGSNGHTTNCRPDLHYRVFLEDAGASGEDLRRWYPMLDGTHVHRQCGSWDIPPDLHDTAWVAGLAEDYIQRQAGGGQPWFCWASFQDPHEPFRCPEPWFSRVDMSQVDVFPGYRPGEFDDRHPIYNALLRHETAPYSDNASIPCCGNGEGGWSDARHAALQATLGMIGFLDEQVGRLLATLERTNQLENTVIFYTSDHGELHGHHGLWGKGAAAFDDCQRVPLLAYGPGRVRPRGDCDALVNLVDLPATFLGLAGAPCAQGMQGVDLSPILDGSADAVQDATLVECHATLRFNQQTFITDRWKLVVFEDSGEGELYDLREDPDQSRNLWSDPACEAVRGELLIRFLRFQMKHSGCVHPRRAFA